MHIPDGFINLPTAAGFGAAAAGGVWYSIRRAARLLDDRRIPLAGLVAAFYASAAPQPVAEAAYLDRFRHDLALNRQILQDGACGLPGEARAAVIATLDAFLAEEADLVLAPLRWILGG